MAHRNFFLFLLGTASLLVYLAAFGLEDLRKNTLGFEIAFFSAFVLYLTASALIIRQPTSSSGTVPYGTLFLIFLFAVVFRLVLLPTRPTLSDDMYRYVWDGRVQANGLSPYRYPPGAEEVAYLKEGDHMVWRYINRKPAVTIYPPGAQLVFAGIWRVVGDSVTGFKAAFVLMEMLGGVLLMGLLRRFDKPLEYALIYLWSPLLVFEVAHAGHVDGLMLPFLIAAFWARATDRPVWLGTMLAAATLVKLFPALLIPALLPLSWPLSRQNLRAPLKTLLAFGGVIAVGYLVYWNPSSSALGFLPNYFQENFNLGLARGLFEIGKWMNVPGSTLANMVTFGGLAVMGLVFVLRPAESARVAFVRCIWLIGWYTAFTQNLFSWYLLWLLPLIVLFIEPGRFLGFTLNPAAAWLVFSGSVMLSYTFFFNWHPVTIAQWGEYVPLYALLLAAFVFRVRSVGFRISAFNRTVAPSMVDAK